METTNLYELLVMMNPTESQIKEFFIYHCASIKDTMITGVKYGLELAGKDMESVEGKEFIAEVTKHYEDKFPKFVQDSIDAYLKFLMELVIQTEDEELQNEETDKDDPIVEEEVDA